MNKKYIIFPVIFLGSLAIALAFPTLEVSGGEIVKCHFLDCPKHTSICERNTTTVDNLIKTTAVCKDISGKVLVTDTKDEPNTKKGYQTNVYTFRLNYSKTIKNIENHGA